ncbi:hypothetical protein B8W69_28295 [Mycobacterium vulneris]|uniref:Uncharacterized protein n=1 Tax=Mycolicibacterium vulneris TaxID=547163 RepID=A0A1X2KIP2_9MYCO|nr:hypothetical protein [Mycolicibacterium vulneris]OSC21581.1 hypothetical protein B8W69_28295 [Mycolicibacterium vulneris]
MALDYLDADTQLAPVSGPPRSPKRNALGAGLALLGVAVLSLIVLLLFNVLGNWVFAVKLEEGVFPSNSDSVVRSGRLSVLTATALISVATGLAASSIAVRPHPFVQLVAALTLVVLIPALLLVWLCYGLVF